MVEYNKVNVKLSDSQLNKLKSAVKNQTGVTLRMNIKMSKRNNLPHKFFWQQGKGQDWEMQLKIICQLI